MGILAKQKHREETPAYKINKYIFSLHEDYNTTTLMTSVTQRFTLWALNHEFDSQYE